MTDEERASLPEPVGADDIARIVLDLIRDEGSAGRVVVKPVDGAAFTL
jgi:hypothetical protein